jgi:hypothetical protein
VLTAPAHPSSKPDPLLLALVGLPAVGAVTTLAVQLYLSTWGGAWIDVEWLLLNVLLCGWALLPFAAAAMVATSIHRHWRRGSPVAFAGGVLLVGLTVWLLWSVLTSDSSTAVIALVFAPFMQATVVGLTMAGAVGFAKRRRRRMTEDA